VIDPHPNGRGLAMKPLSRTRLEDLLHGFRGKRVLVVGDVYLYEYIWGRMTEISTEGPVPVVHVDSRSHAPGAAGNTAAGIAALGASAILCSVIGDDANGRILTDCLRAKHVDVSPMVTVSGCATNTHTKINARGYHSAPQEVLRMHTVPPGHIGCAAEAAIIEHLERLAPDVDAIILVDLVSSVVTRRIIDVVRDVRAKHSLITVGDSRENVRDMRGMDLIVPNDYEAGMAINLTLDGEQAIERAGQMLMGCQNVQNVIITRGKEGMSAFSRNERPVHLRTCAQDVFDVTGAGDTVSAATTLSLAAGASVIEAAQVANLAAGVAVSKVGTVTVSPDEIIDAHARYTGLAASSKIKTVDELKSIIDSLRREGVKIAWTNGCFDILHTGHLSYLRKARQTADVLVLGVSGDRCVSRLKGPGRPINKQEERAELLAEMECIDYVTIFEQDSPADIIAVLRPDVYVKGGDYTIDTINQVERRVVEGYGGRIELLGHVDGKSTTRIISKIIEGNGAQ